MANVEMSPNPKRIRVFMGGDGKIYEGGPEENLGGKIGNVVGGPTKTNRVPEESGENEETKKQ